MNLDKTTPILKKINRLSELINDIGDISVTEKDLLKGYVLDLYKAITDAEKDEAGAKEIEKDKKKRAKKEKKIEQALAERANPETNNPSPKAAVAAAPIVSEKVSVVEKTEAKEKLVSTSNISSSEMDELFAPVSGTELSDKLSQSPILDLTKAMGINERMFTQSELFGGNKEEMDNMLKALNGLANYEEAKSVLMKSAAVKYNWSDAEKIKKARTFVKLVQRRYK